MATLKKILVHVPSNLCDGFKTKYVTATTNRDTSYDSKIVFLEKTQEIFTKGKIYGTNIQDFNALKELVGTLPSDATSTNIVDYITENVNSVKTAVIGTSGDDKTAKTIYGAKAYASDMASTAAASVEAKLPVVTNGSGITVTPTTDGKGKITYTVSTSAEVFHYKGNKTALSELPSTGNTTGDVWSVGPANAVGSTLYAWDGDEWINIGGANGITGVDTTSSKGVALAKNTNGTVKVNVTPGSVVSGNGSVVTGGTVYTAIAAAEGRCDAKGTAQGLINALGGSATSTNGSYVNVTVNTSKGQVSGVTVSETDALKTAVSNANSALQSVSVLGKTLDNADNSISVADAKTALGLGSAAFVDKSYFGQEAYKIINGLGGSATSYGAYVNVTVNTSRGQVSGVKVSESYMLIDAVSNAYSAVQSVSVLGKTLNKTTNSLSVDEAKTALGLGTAAYENKSAFDAAGAASTAAAGVEAKLPVVTNGSGITVTPTTDGNGKTTYKVSTSAEVFHYKGNKTALSELPSTGNTTGDVWSVGPANAVGSTLYAWDGDEWINIGGANGITGVDTTSSKGVALAKNTNGTVKVNVTPGSVASGNGSVVTGGAVYTAIAAAEGRCDAKGTAQGLIDKLGGSATSSNGSYVNVTVNTSKGQVSGVTVSETDALKTAVSNANSALQSITILGTTLNKKYDNIGSHEIITGLGLGTAAFENAQNFADTSSVQDIRSELSLKDTEIGNLKTEFGIIETDFYNIKDNFLNNIDGDKYITTDAQPGMGGKWAQISLDETEVFNYVSDNMWETYTA